MSAALIDGRGLAGELRVALAGKVARLVEAGMRPGLGTVLFAGDYAAAVYEARLRRLAERLGCYYVCEELPRDVAEPDAIATVGKLDADPRVSGVLVLRPLPPNLSEPAVYQALDPLKDIEAVHPANAGLLALGRPRYIASTPASCFLLLDRYIEQSGRDPGRFYAASNVVIVGRSANVGKPAFLLAIARNATVTSCDEHTYAAGRLYEHTSKADVLIVAAGSPGLIGGEHVREGVIAVDVGMNPLTDSRSGRTVLVGDLDHTSVAAKAEAITPVPGGVGPVTQLWLLENTVSAAQLAASYAPPELL